MATLALDTLYNFADYYAAKIRVSTLAGNSTTKIILLEAQRSPILHRESKQTEQRGSLSSNGLRRIIKSEGLEIPQRARLWIFLG